MACERRKLRFVAICFGRLANEVPTQAAIAQEVRRLRSAERLGISLNFVQGVLCLAVVLRPTLQSLGNSESSAQHRIFLATQAVPAR